MPEMFDPKATAAAAKVGMYLKHIISVQQWNHTQLLNSTNTDVCRPWSPLAHRRWAHKVTKFQNNSWYKPQTCSSQLKIYEISQGAVACGWPVQLDLQRGLKRPQPTRATTVTRQPAAPPPPRANLHPKRKVCWLSKQKSCYSLITYRPSWAPKLVSCFCVKCWVSKRPSWASST